jgi:hypothetical protein
MTCARLAELTVWLSGLLGIMGSLILVFPVLYLLSSREAEEDLDEDGDSPQSDRTERLFAKARRILWRRIRGGRRVARVFVWIGGVLLAIALILASIQGYCTL